MGFFNWHQVCASFGKFRIKGLKGIKEELPIFTFVIFLVGRQCNTLRVSEVTHRSYFQCDMLISTMVTFCYPDTNSYGRVKIDKST